MSKRKIRTKNELLIIAATAHRTGNYTFEVPSESKEGKVWRVDVQDRTCRDQHGLGCIPMFNYRTCKHYEACILIMVMLDQWVIPEGELLWQD